MSFRVGSSGWATAIVAVALFAACDRHAQADPLPDGYPLANAPLAAYDRFLQTPFGKHDPIPEVERQFLAHVWALRSKKDSPVDDGLLLDAMWFASGADRNNHAGPVEQLVSGANTDPGTTG